MSARGPKRTFGSLRPMSASGQKPTCVYHFFLRQRLRDVAGVLDEKLRDRAERAVLQGDDSDRHAGIGSLTGKTLISGPGGKSQTEVGKIVRKRPVATRLIRTSGERSDHSHARIVETAGAKDVHCDRPNHAFRRWQHPRFVHQLGKRDPAPPSPRASRARHDDE